MSPPAVPPWQPTPLGEAEHPEVRALFEQVFGTPMSEALWRWKYDGGRGMAWGVRQAQGDAAALREDTPPPQQGAAALVAHYGGTRRVLCLDGREIDAVQMGDVMVRADARGILSRSGPFARVTRGFIQTHVGPRPRHAVGFGFPSARHARLGELLGLYRALGEVRELHWRTQGMDSPPGWRWNLVPWSLEGPREAARTWARVDALWSQMRQALGAWVLPQRDALWCQHRYLAHPHHRYRLVWLRCRITHRIRGALVLRLHGAVAGGADTSWEWVDWIGTPRHLRLALAVARATAARQGVQALHGWFSAPLIDRYLLPGALPTPQPDPQSTVACTWCVTIPRATDTPPGLDHAPWWLTSGDTDFR